MAEIAGKGRQRGSEGELWAISPSMQETEKAQYEWMKYLVKHQKQSLKSSVYSVVWDCA